MTLTVASPVFWRSIRADASGVGPIFVCLSLMAALLSQRFAPELCYAVYLCGILGAAAVLPWRRRPWEVYAALGIMVASAWLAVPGSIWWGEGHQPATVRLALYVTPAALLPLLQIPVGRALAFFSPVFPAHSLLLIAQAFLSPGRVSGIMGNPNLGAGLLVIGAVYLMQTKYRLLAALPIGVLPLTGSRWALLVMAVLGVGLVLQNRQNWRVVALGGLLALALTWATWSQVADNYRLGGDVGANSQRVTGDIRHRLELASFTGLPQGVSASDGLHNTPQRMLFEWGGAATAAWLALTGWALWRRPRFTPGWWLILSLVMLGGMDYYPMWPHFMAWWFLGVSERHHGNHGGVERRDYSEPHGEHPQHRNLAR